MYIYRSNQEANNHILCRFSTREEPAECPGPHVGATDIGAGKGRIHVVDPAAATQ